MQKLLMGSTTSRAGVELPVLPALTGGEEPLKNAADDVVIEAGEIEVMNLVDEGAPVGHGAVGVERDAVADAGVVLAKDRLIIRSDHFGFLEIALQVQPQVFALGEMLWGRELGHLLAIALKQGLMEDQLIYQGITGVLGGPLQVVPYPFEIIDDEPALSPHPLVKFCLEPGLLVSGLQFFLGEADGQVKGRFQNLEEFFIRQLGAQGSSA